MCSDEAGFVEAQVRLLIVDSAHVVCREAGRSGLLLFCISPDCGAGPEQAQVSGDTQKWCACLR